MMNLKLDREEREILRAYDRGELKPVRNFVNRKQALIQAARATIAKRRNINIRISEEVLTKLQAKAITEGLPYQTLVGSILHKYANGTL